MADILASGICTAKWTADGPAGSCKTAGSCCLAFAENTTGTAKVGVNLVCFPAGNLAATVVTIDANV